jgi:hypothetical protein
MKFVVWLKYFFLIAAGSALLAFSNNQAGDPQERVRAFTRPMEFDYVSWTFEALGVKLGQFALGITKRFPVETQRQVVFDYLLLVENIQRLEGELYRIYSDPNVRDPETASRSVREQLAGLQSQRARLGPLAESVLQSQIAHVVADLDLGLGGEALPPVLFHTTPLPTALIVSPRNIIRQEYNISLVPDLPVDQRETLEASVDQAVNMSSLVVDIGGIGVYPTMVIETTDLNYLTVVAAHEWIHNYFTLRPLGWNYFASPELRTMNETAATIAGNEIGRAVMERYYPDLLPPAPVPSERDNEDLQPPEPTFDFRAEMRETRVRVDQLLADGQIEEAEAYMESRRQVFWEHGYAIRKLNQAYFAFHGAYADQPGGAAGEDPVGAAVRALRARSGSLAAFLKTIAWMTSFEQLWEVVDDDAG